MKFEFSVFNLKHKFVITTDQDSQYFSRCRVSCLNLSYVFLFRKVLVSWPEIPAIYSTNYLVYCWVASQKLTKQTDRSYSFQIFVMLSAHSLTNWNKLNKYWQNYEIMKQSRDFLVDSLLMTWWCRVSTKIHNHRLLALLMRVLLKIFLYSDNVWHQSISVIFIMLKWNSKHRILWFVRK